MTLVTGAILDLVCGLPSPQRERWPIMALQAYVDDSVADGRVLVLAGYISTAERWSRFSTEWRQRLDMSPRIPVFKMSEVDLSSDLQMERVRFLYRVIEEHVMCSAAVAVQIDALSRLVNELGLVPEFSNPYHLAHKAIINFVAQSQREIGMSDKIDFIFDKRSEARLIKEGFANYVRTSPPDILSVTGDEPIFRDDATFLPIQAADLLAWWTRKAWLENGSITARNVTFPWKKVREIPSMSLDLNEPELREELDLMKRRAQITRRLSPYANVTLTVNFHPLRRASPDDEDGSTS